MTEYTLKPGPKKFAIYFGFAIIAFILGWFLSDSMVRVRPILDYTIKGVLFVVPIMLVIILPITWLMKKTHISFSNEGIQFNDSRKDFGLIPWNEIGEIQTSRFLFIPVVEIYHKASNELMKKVSDPKKIKNIEMISMISGTTLGINMLFYDQKASDLKTILEDFKRENCYP